MSEMEQPTDAEKAGISKRLSEVANILRAGVFAGAHAPAVAAALQWLDQGGSFFAPPASPVPEQSAPDLKVVANEQK